MSTVTYRGQLAIGEEAELKLSTNNGLTGYRIKQFKIMSSTPGVGSTNMELIGKVTLTSEDKTSSISTSVNFNDPSLVAVRCVFYSGNTNPTSQEIIMDGEIFNQDVFVNITDAAGGTIPCNYFLELEKMKLDLNASTISTLKNIRQSKADTL